MKPTKPLKKILKEMGDLGILTCYRIAPFMILLNNKSIGFKYSHRQRLVKHVDVFDINFDGGSFSVDEWGNLLKEDIKKEDKAKVEMDLSMLLGYLPQSLLRTLFFKAASCKELNLNAVECINGIVVPVFLEAYNFYDFNFSSMFKKMKEKKITVKKFLGKKEMELKVKDGKDKLVLECEGNKIEIPKIKFDLKKYTEEYKPRALILENIKKYWIFGKDKNPPNFLLDPFNIGQIFQFFSEFIINEARKDERFNDYWESNEFISKSKISVPEAVIEGKDDVIIAMGVRLGAILGCEFAEVYNKRFI